MDWQHQDIQQAAQRLAPYHVLTPCLRNDYLDALSGAQLWFKCENLQRTGAFKFRGACNALLQLSEQQRQQGVFTVSSGNHGAALACAGQLLAIPVQVAVPNNAPQVKKDNIARYCQHITEIAPGMAAREQFINARQQQPGTLIPPYNHAHIIQGQATAAWELCQQQPQLDTLLAPLGGGGLLSGTVRVARSLGIEQVIGAEPANADDAYQSLRSGQLQPARPPESVCDGLLTSLGEHTFAILQAGLDRVLLVDDEQVIDAMQLLWLHLKMVVEPSSAITLAAVLAYPEYFSGRQVGIILSGGNVDLKRLPWH